MKTVTLASFADHVQAHMMQDILNDEGIASMLQGEMTHQVLSPLANLGIQLLVFEGDLGRARELLKQAFPEASDFQSEK